MNKKQLEQLEEAAFVPADKALLWGWQVLNSYAFENLGGNAAYLRALAEDACA